jgi:ATP-dependent protease Clp ATPase subunit
LQVFSISNAIGQERAKKSVVRRGVQPLQFNQREGKDDAELGKSNIQMISPQARARRYWRKTLARLSTFLLSPSPMPLH